MLCYAKACKALGGGGCTSSADCTAILKGTEMHWRQKLHWIHGHMAERCKWDSDVPAALCHPRLFTA